MFCARSEATNVSNKCHHFQVKAGRGRVHYREQIVVVIWPHIKMRQEDLSEGECVNGLVLMISYLPPRYSGVEGDGVAG